MEQLLYIFLAIVGLGILVFIHELGHYLMAVKAGMKVEAFAIGFGKPLWTWERKGVKWHLCILPFGGYVKIAGMQKEGALEPHQIVDGFYGKAPWKRIQVALAGPAVNIGFAFLAFTCLWLLGGRTQDFSEHTHRIGWVDPQSPLYASGVRPGDAIERYNGRPFNGMKDLMLASILDGDTNRIQGYKVDAVTGRKTPFDYTLPTYDRVGSEKKGLRFATIGLAHPAQYLIFNQAFLEPGAPIAQSGIQDGDRIIWADGEVLFSQDQLVSSINQSTAFLTVRRGDAMFHAKIPRVQLDELKMSSHERAEVDDWQHEAGLKGRIQDLYFIPYTLSPKGLVESRLHFIDEENQKKAFSQCQRCAYFNPLQEGDQIVAVDGYPVQNAYDLLQRLQSRRVLLIVQRDPAALQKVSSTLADEQFDRFGAADLEALVSQIGLGGASSSGKLHLLQPVTPLAHRDFPAGPNSQSIHSAQIEKQKQAIEKIKDLDQRASLLRQVEKAENRLILGLPLKDRAVLYNPTPFYQFGDTIHEMGRTLAGLFTGSLSPKFMSGPVGIVQVVHHSWSLGFKEALFWLAVISLNLGFINLLPLPVLDGGHIVFAAVEWVTKKPLSSKTMERLIIPFVGLLIGLFVYITFHDISRLLGSFF